MQIMYLCKQILQVYKENTLTYVHARYAARTQNTSHKRAYHKIIIIGKYLNINVFYRKDTPHDARSLIYCQFTFQFIRII